MASATSSGGGRDLGASGTADTLVRVRARLAGDPARGLVVETVMVNGDHEAACALPLGEALRRHRPGFVEVEGLELLVDDDAAWSAMRQLPVGVARVRALGLDFDLANELDGALWRLTLRLLAEPGSGEAEES